MKFYLLDVFAVVVYVVCLVVHTQCADDLCQLDVNVCFCHFNQSEFLSVNVDCSFSYNIELSTTSVLPQNVSSLDLSRNSLTEIVQSNFFTSKSMKKLCLQNNQIGLISNGSLNLPALTYLDLSHNELEVIDPLALRQLKKLEYLNLAYNKFKMFKPGNLKYLNLLEVIILNDNPLGEYLEYVSLFQENGLALNPKIEAISVAGTNLSIVPDNFLTDGYNLRHLSLSRNNITTVPELPFTLEYLDLSDTFIAEMDADDFSNMPALKVLLLNNLLLREVPDFVFAAIKGLKTLQLKGNKQLRIFSALAFGQDVLDDSDDFMLEELSLRESRLSTLSEELKMPFSRLTKLDLQGNPWQCDCRLKWIKELQIPFTDYDFVRCFLPIALHNSRVFETDAESFQCPSPSRQLHRIGSGVVVLLCLVLMALAVWLVFLLPRSYQKRLSTTNVVGPNSPYSLITIEPNAAEDYR